MTDPVRFVDALAARRIGIASDTHGILDPRVRTELLACDVVIHAGDIGGPEVLGSLDHPCVVAVRGNNDTPRHWRGPVSELPEAAVLRVFNGTIAVIHGHQFPRAGRRHAQLRERFADAQFIVYGHSHRRCIDDSTLPWVINPGASGRARTYGGPSLLIARRARNRWRIDERVFPPG